ncbi:hypothetical protein N7326_08110 [Corynebacterium sp. ES2794-CONJ1]|uniref:hypothetical protein n=1 Tax=unclassified Corynebacterium TaxID=2624378 RepID=UPI00216801D3|nr:MULTISPECIES: hypothetical protein [unclassified Corynebacterium]MCS4490600.1 hypothetical protein [Corynebacterium sp. ES2775-CONJ]MCS4492379.1 hypothetical protein [Corynebacterium sp. ES2715-CONJ3]MCS4532429.1 hypothetical protein [Corynebacterium sp. ES2730-CONJ]MCU9519824.1 hypothetical protein [Corynebacterium sp. ES2794-CONJ1]
MFQFVVGAAAGYIFGTKAGRRRYEQMKRGYRATMNSPVTKYALGKTRSALANKLDPQPRLREVKGVKKSKNDPEIFEVDHD